MTVGGHMTVFHDGIGRVVQGEFTQGNVVLGEQRLLNSTVSIAMLCVGSAFQAHMVESGLKPHVELVS